MQTPRRRSAPLATQPQYLRHERPSQTLHRRSRARTPAKTLASSRHQRQMPPGTEIHGQHRTTRNHLRRNDTRTRNEQTRTAHWPALNSIPESGKPTGLLRAPRYPLPNSHPHRFSSPAPAKHSANSRDAAAHGGTAYARSGHKAHRPKSLHKNPDTALAPSLLLPRRQLC